MGTTAHSVFGASSMYRWKACPGSIRECEGVENVSSSYAEEGTRAHEEAAKSLLEGTVSANEHVKMYVDLVRKEAEGAFLFLVEEKVDLSIFVPGAFGTADTVTYYGPPKNFIRVYDFKYGQGIGVDVENNDQLLFYAAGAMCQVPHSIDYAEVVIVQPRYPHPEGAVRRWKFKAIEIIDWLADLEEAFKRTQDPNAPLLSGDHCRFCPAARKCPALQKSANELAKTEFSPVVEYDAKDLGETLQKFSAVEGYIKAVREFAYQEAMKGRLPLGWKLVQKRATRRWKEEQEAVTVLDAEGVSDADMWEAPKFKSPAQMEKLVSKKVVDSLCISESTGFTLVEESDKRTAVPLADPQLEFTVI